jgi:putative DNA primase/helicase
MARKSRRAILANAATALRHAPECKGMLGFDKFSQEAMDLSPPPWVDNRRDWKPRPWTDVDDIRLAEWLQHQGILVNDRVVALAVQVVAAENSYNPVTDYLDALHWDGEGRLETLLPEILGAKPSLYVQAACRCFLVGAVARAYDPGCKVDTVPVFEGGQGVRKSTFLRELFGEPHFTDDMPDLGTKDAAITIGSAWCIELSELSAMVGIRREMEAIKAFITRRVDNFRPPYGRRNVKRPRHCVLAGTTNSDDWIRDDTGARRFWPIRCGEIEIELLIQHRNQLWAEAVALYRLGPDDGGAWWFTDKSLVADACEQAEARRPPDPWEQLVLDYVATKRETTGAEVLMQCLSVKAADLTQGHYMRVANILRRAGWRKERIWKRGQVWIAPDYQPPTNPDDGGLE